MVYGHWPFIPNCCTSLMFWYFAIEFAKNLAYFFTSSLNWIASKLYTILISKHIKFPEMNHKSFFYWLLCAHSESFAASLFLVFLFLFLFLFISLCFSFSPFWSYSVCVCVRARSFTRNSFHSLVDLFSLADLNKIRSASKT